MLHPRTAETDAPLVTDASDVNGDGPPAAPDPELQVTARALINAGRRLERVGDDGVDGAIVVVADARASLERSERELVSLARARGRSWAQIAAELAIMTPRVLDAQTRAAVRYARRRRTMFTPGEIDDDRR